MSIKERKQAIDNIARLWRAEKENPSADIAVVRENLEAQLEGTVSRSLSASQLGVSHTALNNWITAGEVPVVISRRGRKEIPIPALLKLLERVEEERKSGRRKLHVLEPAMTEARDRARRIRPETLAPGPRNRSDPHRIPELRSLAYHRALARRLRRPMVEEARRKLRRWREEEKISHRYVELWEEVLALPMPEIRKAIVADDERGRDLRQNSPLAGLLTEPERRRVLEAI